MATAELCTTRVTPEQFLELPDRERFELVGGELVEMPEMSLEGSAVAIRLAMLFARVAHWDELGVLFGADATYQCFPEDPERVRRPDVSFIRRGRLRLSQYERGHCRIAPDLAVEVVSPHDLHHDVVEKVREYQAAGVPLVWVISPEIRSVMVYRADGSVADLRAADVLDGGDVVPGFRVAVGELFPSPSVLAPEPAVES
jgi:Uma2 family endonuclease